MTAGLSKGLREASIALSLSGITGLLAGLVLGNMTGTLEAVPGLMILIPPAIGMRGNIFGALGSRLGTAMHTGIFSLDLSRRSGLSQNLYAATVLTVVGGVSLGFLATAAAVLTGAASASLSGMVFISLVSGVLSGAVLMVATLAVSKLGFDRGWDIDNTTAPLVTAMGDFLTLPALYAATLLLAVIPDGSRTPLLLVFTVLAAASLEISRRTDMSRLRRIVGESTPSLIVGGGIMVLAGVTLEASLTDLIALPALLVLIPPFLEEAGALGGILASRLSSAIHTGLLEPDMDPRGAEREFLMTIALALYVFPLLGLLSHYTAEAFGMASPGPLQMVMISLVSGFATSLLVCLVAFYVSVISFRHGLDPDNHGIVIVTSFVDVVGVIILMATILAFT